MAAGLGGAEEHFAKKLANNDKKIRDRAVKRLQAWISSRISTSPAFGEIELLKIWKGLFYCFWMSDKALIQEELALNISNLLHSFKNIDSGINFIITFFKTFHKEWHGIDRLRLDKFYMLIRFFVKENLELLRKHNWELSLCTRLANVYKEGPLSPTLDTITVGIRLHLCSIFFAELKEIDQEVPSEACTILLDPYFILAAKTKSKNVSKSVQEGIFEKILELKSNISTDDKEEDSEDEKQHNIQMDLNEISQRLFTLASDREILERNRAMLYLYIKKFKKYIPVDEACQSSEVATNRKRKIDEQEDQKERNGSLSKKKKKEKKKNQPSAVEMSAESEAPVENLLVNGHKEASTKKKRKEKKNKEKINVEDRKQQENHIGLSQSLIESEETAKNVEEKETNGKMKPKSLINGVETNQLAEKRLLDENQNEKRNTTGRKKKRLLHNESLQNDALNKNNTIEKYTEQSQESHVSEQSAQMHHTSEDDLDKALKEMREKISEKNSAVQTPEHNKKKKEKMKRNLAPHAFATFSKSKTPPAYVKRRIPSTEPKKSKEIQLTTPKSAPHPTRKKVTIKLSKNKSQTTSEYAQSVKTSPLVPFDASKSPAFGLLKTELSQSTPKNKKSTPMKRSKAVDFF